MGESELDAQSNDDAEIVMHEDQKQQYLSETMFNIFNFRILALLVCRGSPNVKAGYLFDLVYKGKEIPEKVIIWSNSKLRKAFDQIYLLSEIMPKMFYLKFDE